MSVPAQKSSIPLFRQANELIRGGRIRKTSKGLISFAPFLAGASALALGALLATSSPVRAGHCTETGTTGMWICSGAVGTYASGYDAGRTIAGRLNQNISVTGDATFALDTSYSQDFGINVDSVATTGTINVDFSNSNDITSYYDAIFIDQDGTGAVTVTANGDIESSDYEGIQINQSGNGNVTVTTDGTVTGGLYGIYITTTTGTTGGVNLTTNGAVTGSAEGIKLDIDGNNAVTVTTTGTVESSNSEDAIEVDHSGAGDVNITTSGNVTAETDAKDAIRVHHSGTGNVNITTSATVTAKDASNDAINVNHTGTGNISLTVDGSVVGGSSANAINLSTASGSATIIFGTGASFTRGIDVSGVSGTASLEIGGTGDRSFDIGNIPAITGERNFNKNGNHALIVTGTHASGATFEQTSINEGKLVWGGTDFRTTNLTIGNGATLEITGGSSFTNTSATLSGRLELTGNNSNITVDSLTGNGSIDIDVDFSAGDTELTNARLTATSVTGRIPVNIRSVGGFPEIPENEEDGEEDRTVSIGNIIRVTGTANADAFVMGRALNGGFRFVELVHDDSSGQNVWMVVAEARNTGSIEDLLADVRLIEVALYESLPAALTQLASLESYPQRLQGRQHGGNGGVWAKVSGGSTEFEPTSTSLATHEIGNVAAEFGIDVPLLTDYPYIPYNLTVGASAVFGDASTDVAAGNSTGEIATRTFKTSILATWELEDAYVDGQLQYATFGNEIKAKGKLADENATAYSAGLEVGYGFDIEDFRVTPSAQLTWTSVDFDNFTDLANTRVALDDDTVLTGRAGVGIEGAVPSLPEILLRGRADLLMPLDGKVATRINETKLTSEQEDLVFDVGMGATYAWNETYALSADISTQQGGEVGGYAGNIGFKYKF